VPITRHHVTQNSRAYAQSRSCYHTERPPQNQPPLRFFGWKRSLALNRLRASAANPQTRTFLEALASATLDGQTTLANAQLVGIYTAKSGNPSVTIIENEGKLCQRREDSSTQNIILRSVGGDRYAPDGLPIGFSLTFVLRDQNVELVLVRPPLEPSVLQKQ
jgi:hypothetical protein